MVEPSLFVLPAAGKSDIVIVFCLYLGLLVQN